LKIFKKLKFRITRPNQTRPISAGFQNGQFCRYHQWVADNCYEALFRNIGSLNLFLSKRFKIFKKDLEILKKVWERSGSRFYTPESREAACTYQQEEGKFFGRRSFFRVRSRHFSCSYLYGFRPTDGHFWAPPLPLGPPIGTTSSFSGIISIIVQHRCQITIFSTSSIYVLSSLKVE